VPRTSQIPPRTYGTVEEIAAELRLSEETIRRYCRDGSIPNVRVGREYRIPLSWLRGLEERATA